MSVNQDTERRIARPPPPRQAGGRRQGAKDDARTDMVGKALGLLVLLGDEPRGASAAELSRRAELPFSTTYRLLGSLTRDGFVDYEPDGRRYRLGLRVFQLGQRVSNHHGFAGTALPILRRVTEETGEATILSVRDGKHHLTVNKVDGPQTFRVTSDPGHLGALHTTSVGKALVAFADDATRSRLVEEPGAGAVDRRSPSRTGTPSGPRSSSSGAAATPPWTRKTSSACAPSRSRSSMPRAMPSPRWPRPFRFSG